MENITFNERKPLRLDAFLQKKYETLTLGAQNKFLRENKIKVNGKKVPLSTKLSAGDEIKLFINDDVLNVAQKKYNFLYAKNIFTPVFEDDNLLIADKPAGVIVNDNLNEKADTFLNRALRYLYENEKYKPETDSEPQLCHRLDTGTSGLVIIAKNTATGEFIENLIKNHSIKKEYLCVTFNIPSPKKGTLKGFHTKNAQNAVVKITSDKMNDTSKPVETRYEVLATSGVLALLRVQLITGRTHQIRAHMESIGCPILGDSKYGNNLANRQRKLKYQALCSWKLTFPQIDSGDFEKYSKLEITAEKPWYCEQIVNKTLR